MNRRQALLSLVGLAPAAIAATPEPKPEMALSYVAPMCPRCGAPAMFVERQYDTPVNGLARVICSPACGWTGIAPFGHKIS